MNLRAAQVHCKKPLLLLFAKHERNESEITLGFLLLCPAAGSVREMYLGLSLQSCARWERSILCSLSLGICKTWLKLGEKIVVKDSQVCKVWMVQSFRGELVPGGAGKGQEML